MCLETQKTDKASGFCGLHAEPFRFDRLPTPDGGTPAPHLLAPCLTGFLNAMFAAGRIPGRYNVLTITPVLTDAKGDLLSSKSLIRPC